MLKQINKYKVFILILALLIFIGGLFSIFIIIPSPEYTILRFSQYYQSKDSQKILDFISSDYFENSQNKAGDIIENQDNSESILQNNFIKQIENQTIYNPQQNILQKIITGQNINKTNQTFDITLNDLRSEPVTIYLKKEGGNWKINEIRSQAIINLINDEEIPKTPAGEKLEDEFYSYEIFSSLLSDEGSLFKYKNVDFKASERFFILTLKISKTQSGNQSDQYPSPYKINQVYLVDKFGNIIKPSKTGLENQPLENQNIKPELFIQNFSKENSESSENINQELYINYFFDTSEEAITESWLLIESSLMEV